MADILGPSGQPLPSNPLLSQQQGVSSTATVNTTQAQKAFAELQRVLDNIMKSFSGNWDKMTTDRLKSEERFYRAVGDKAKERQVMLQRYSKEALDSIEAEKRAGLEALSMQGLAKEELEKRKTEITRRATEERANIEKETAKKLAQDRGIGGAVRGITSFVGGQVGGSVGGLITGVGALIANPATAVPAAIFGSLLEMANTQAAFTRTGAQLSGAGLRLGAGGGAGLGFATGLFGGPFGSLGQALGADQQREILGMMAGSRTMVDQARSRGGFGAIQGNLGLFANILPDATKEMELFTDATKNLGMSQKDITGLFVSSRVNAERLKITQLDAINAQMEMGKALRNITNDGAVAATVLGNIGGFLQSMGTMNEQERTRVTSGIVQAGANLSLPQIAGMFSFTRGRMPNLSTEVFGPNGVLQHGGVFGLMGGFMQKMGGQFADPNEKLFAADILRQQFAPNLRLQDVPKFFDIMGAASQPGAKMADLEKQFRILESKSPQVAMAQGIETLASIVGPIQRLEHVFSNFWTKLDALVNQILEKFHISPIAFAVNTIKSIGKHPSGQSGRHSGSSGSF